jgi:hypothetical protein
METPFRLNATEAPSSPPDPPIGTTITDTPTTLEGHRPPPSSPSQPYSQAPEAIKGSVEPFPSSYPLGVRSQLKNFSDATHRLPGRPNKKRRAPASPSDPFEFTKTQRTIAFGSAIPQVGYKELVLQARELVIKASLVAPSPEEQSQVLDLLEVFREYTEKGRVTSITRIIGSQVSNLETATRKIEKIARAPPTNQPNSTQEAQVQKAPTLAQIASQGPPATTAPQEWKLVQKKASKPLQPAQGPPKVCKRLILVQSSTGTVTD